MEETQTTKWPHTMGSTLMSPWWPFLFRCAQPACNWCNIWIIGSHFIPYTQHISPFVVNERQPAPRHHFIWWNLHGTGGKGRGGRRDVLHDFPACRFVTDTLRLNPGLTAPGGPLKQRLRGIKSEWCEQMRRTVTWLATRDVWWMDRAAVWMGRLNWAVWPGGAHQSGAAPEVSAEAVQWCEQHVPRPPVASQVWGSALSKHSSPPCRRSYHPSRGPEPRHATHFC